MARKATTDEGSSLVETVIAVSLMGLVVAGVLGAMWSSVRLSRFSDDQAKVEAIKTAIQKGDYPLDARRIAESFYAIEQMIKG